VIRITDKKGVKPLKKRLIKKKVKALSDKELNECVSYGKGYWRIFSEKEFDKRQVKPYSDADYEKAKQQGLDLDDWNDYVKHFGIGDDETEDWWRS
jgi:hypothetical protein